MYVCMYAVEELSNKQYSSYLDQDDDGRDGPTDGARRDLRFLNFSLSTGVVWSCFASETRPAVQDVGNW